MEQPPAAAAAASPTAAALTSLSPGSAAGGARLAPEVEDARARLVKALHGTLLQSHVNAPKLQAAAVDALLTMVQNVLRAPEEPKFRAVRAGNAAFKGRIAAARGGEDFLHAAGWRDVTRDFERHLVLPPAAEGGALQDECVARQCGVTPGPLCVRNVTRAGRRARVRRVLRLAERLLLKVQQTTHEKAEARTPRTRTSRPQLAPHPALRLDLLAVASALLPTRGR